MDLLKENGIFVVLKIMLEGGELFYVDYMCFVFFFFELEVVDGIVIICEVCSVKILLEIEFFCWLVVLYV